MLFGLFQSKPRRVYCQSCDIELTDEGGDITNTRRIYCHGYQDDTSSCMEKGEFFGHGNQGVLVDIVLIANYANPQEVQKAIRRKKLKEFGRLERDVAEARSV